MPSVGWSVVMLAAIGLWSSGNAFSALRNHASPSGSPTGESEEYNLPECIVPTVHFGGGGIIVWAVCNGSG
jgi:hypothetical protein